VGDRRARKSCLSIGTPGSDQQNFSLTTLQPFINYNFGHGLAAGSCG
jgi:hypothetical protein